MRVKTSVTLSKELLDAIDRTDTGDGSRSELLERATWKLLREQWRRERDERDLEIINTNADELNALALEVLEYQADPWDDEDDLEHAS